MTKNHDELTPPAASPDKATAEREYRERQEARLAEREEAIAWLEEQLSNWQQAAAERDAQIVELQAWAKELEEGKNWLDEQRLRWQRQAEQHENTLLAINDFAGNGQGDAEAILQRLQLAVEQVPPTQNTEGAVLPFSRQKLLEPLSRRWGFDRGLPIDRFYIEGFLGKHAADIHGHVLEIGDNSYTLRFGGSRVTKSDVLDRTEGRGVTIVADLAQARHLPSDVFDCIIFTQTLQLIYDARAALQTLWRMLKPGGTLLLTCPGLSPISQVEWSGSWYWRLTEASLGQLLQDAAPGLTIEVQSHGNVLAACAFLYGLAAEELLPEELDYHDRNYEVILSVRATKSTAAIPIASRHGHAPAHSLAEAKALVLMYHRIATTEPDPWGITVTPEHFGEHMEVLRRNFSALRLPQLAEATSGRATPGTPIVVTFDDGYADNLYAALPHLECNGIPATVFVCTGAIGQYTEFWWDTMERLFLRPGRLPESLRLEIDGQAHSWSLANWAEYDEADFQLYAHWLGWDTPPTPRHQAFAQIWQLLNKMPPDKCRAVVAELVEWAGPSFAVRPPHPVMGLDELQIMARSDLVDFGAHTVNHPSLATLPLRMQQAEITGSQRWLQEALGREVETFSFPYGRPEDYSAETLALLRGTGIRYACTTQLEPVRGATDCLQVPRCRVVDCDGEDFARQLYRWLNL